jgi:tetratricopeptide (TPR) repeat protein
MTARDIRLAQAASLVQLGDEWMGRPAHPTPRVKYAHASRLYESAADTFRTFGRWRAAGDAYSRAGEAEKKQSEVLVAGTYYIDSAECYERVDPTEAIRMYAKAVGLYATMGRFVSAASVQSRVAELYESDGANADAANAYQYAADYFLGDDLYSQAVMTLYKSGVCLCRDAVYLSAHEKFERAAKFASDDNLIKFRCVRTEKGRDLGRNRSALMFTSTRAWMITRVDRNSSSSVHPSLPFFNPSRNNLCHPPIHPRSVPEMMFDAALCLIAEGDLPRAEDYIIECSRRDAGFAVGRERRFLYDIIDCARASEVDDFVDHVWNMDYVDALDPFELKVRRRSTGELACMSSPQAISSFSKEPCPYPLYLPPTHSPVPPPFPTRRC